MTAIRWSEFEEGWGGFLVDLCVKDTIPILEQMGFDVDVTRMRHDDETVHEAWDASRTVVTANESDFIRYTLEHQKRDSGKLCNNAWGLLSVPNHAGKRERWLSTLKKGIRSGNELIPWPAAAYANLCVKLRDDGQVTLRRFRRCAHCAKTFPIKEAWYQNLPELG